MAVILPEPEHNSIYTVLKKKVEVVVVLKIYFCVSNVFQQVLELSEKFKILQLTKKFLARTKHPFFQLKFDI